MKNLLKFLLLFVFALSLLGLNLSCKKATPTPTPEASTSESISSSPSGAAENLLTVDPSSVTSNINANLETSKQKAVQWKPDVAFVSSSAKITPSLDLNDVIEVYTYGTDSQPYYWWTISISLRSKNYVRALIPREDYLGASLKPIQSQYLKVNYVEAFQKADNNGGKEWREKQGNNNYLITATLAHGEPGSYLYWTVNYQNNAGSDKKTIQINANDGEIVNPAD